MKIVVTGGLGFIGVNFARYMKTHAPQHELHCVDWSREAALSDFTLYRSVCRADFASGAARALYRRAHVIVHLAATTTVQESIANPAASFENNVTRTHTLLEELRQSAPACHFVFASTGGAIIGEHNGPIHEALPPRPLSPYGATKLAVEGMLTAYAGSYGMATTALRFSNVYGPHSERKSSVVAKFCKDVLRTGRLTVNGDGAQTRDYVHVADICQGIWRAIDTRATGPFQLGTGVSTSLMELVDVLRSHARSHAISVGTGKALTGEVRHNVCDIAHAREILGYHPKFDLRRGVADTFDWFRAAQAQEFALRAV